ncbi:Gfo/Idh/MocA family oxidoreductase [Arthrobacter sp. B0490]|uniref:Gfo/Idh/MocA family protein n=1 Tax=Arthrobacter sp. B0490 TaxID=2058891 RepID=UPI000CE41198|nr:Gfo/Idh/MocA family oxidoreductase [Arthrobacter sp. B0490]
MTAYTPIRTAVLGFGVSGKVFHTPLIDADPRYSLAAIVTAHPARASLAAQKYPTARIINTAENLFAAVDSGELELDLVVLGTPPGSHVELAEAAFSRGLNVVVDKPFVPTSAEGESLIDRAAGAGVVVTVFQNRRWDADYLTLKTLLAEGALGQVHSFESRFQWWMPEGFGNWRDEATVAEGGGILHDLGAHLIDQAIDLFGPVTESYGETATHTPTSGADQDSFVSLLHQSGVRSRLWMNGLAAQVGARFHVLGSTAAYTKWGLDGQEPALDAGVLPTDEAYGAEPESSWGLFGIDGATVPVPAERGSYPTFYSQLAAALHDGAPLPVDPAQSVTVLRIIEKIHGAG